MPRFSIWLEAMPWRPNNPTRLGHGTGETFEEACCEWAKRTLSEPWFDKAKLTYGKAKMFSTSVKAIRKKGKK